MSEAYQRMEKGRDGSGSALDIFIKVNGSCKWIKVCMKIYDEITKIWLILSNSDNVIFQP